MTLKDFSIAKLAGMIRKDWTDINPHANEYLVAMEQLEGIKDKYLEVSGEEIVLKFLGIAIAWRGNLAAEIKKELNHRLNEDKK